MSQVLNVKFDEMKSSIFKMIQLAKIYGPEEMQDPKFYTKMSEDFSEIQTRANSSRDIIKKTSNCESVEQFEKIISSQKRKSSKAESKEFLNEIAQLLNLSSTNRNITQTNVDDDLVMQEEISEIDPLTKRRIVDPVKNTVCGHVYDRVPIMEALQMNSRLRCPVTGCSRAIVSAENLVEDVQFRIRLQNAALDSD